MDIGSIFLILGLLILAGLFISRPLFEQRSAAISRQEHEYSTLLAEQDRILNTLQELDLDYALGKIPEAAYSSQRAALLQQGAQVLRSLDAYEAQPSAQTAEARLEAAIAARRAEGATRQVSVSASQAAPDDQLEILIASRRRERKEKAIGFCSQCGSPVQKSDQFCPKCGSKIISAN